MSYTIKTTGVGFGTMSLCIKEDRPTKEQAIRMIEELIDEAQLDFIDTADAYCLTGEEFGYGEDIVAKFAHRDDVLLATKGGFTRPPGEWKRNGDPAYLRAACEASLKRLGVDTIRLYYYHTPDPAVPFEESLGALVQLRNEGKIEHIGVSNVYSLEQLQLAHQVANVRALQNPFSIIYRPPFDSYEEIFRFCEAQGIAFVAYAPLGGHRNPYIIPTLSEKFNQLAMKLSLTPYQLALLRLKALSPSIIPITGSKSKQHVKENLAVGQKHLAPEVIEEIDAIINEPE